MRTIENKLEDIMKNVDVIVICTGIDEDYSDDHEVLLEVRKDDIGDIYCYGFWSRDTCDIMNDDDLFDIVSRTLSERYSMDNDIKNITLFPNGIPEIED